MPVDDISCGLYIIVMTPPKVTELTTATDSGENPLGRIRVKRTRWSQKWLKCRERGHFSKQQRQQKIYLAFNVKATSIKPVSEKSRVVLGRVQTRDSSKLLCIRIDRG
jgi:hypothetical protein